MPLSLLLLLLLLLLLFNSLLININNFSFNFGKLNFVKIEFNSNNGIIPSNSISYSKNADSKFSNSVSCYQNKQQTTTKKYKKTQKN